MKYYYIYGFIQYYNSFFVIIRHIAWHVFILNDLYSGGRNPGKIKNKSTFVAMTSHKHKQKVPQKFYKRKQNSNINCIHCISNINLYTLN